MRTDDRFAVAHDDDTMLNALCSLGLGPPSLHAGFGLGNKLFTSVIRRSMALQAQWLSTWRPLRLMPGGRTSEIYA